LSAAERHYLAAFELAGRAGATFVQRISLVVLASVRARRGDAETPLLGYRDLLDIWEENTGWTLRLTTVRNLSDLLEQLTSDSADLRADAAQLQNGTSADADEMRALVDCPAARSTSCSLASRPDPEPTAEMTHGGA
jgi:hypothetical protein